MEPSKAVRGEEMETSGGKDAAITRPATIEVKLSPNHTPIINVDDDQVLSWRPVSGAVTLTWDDPGLCEESSPLRATPDQPAVCTISPQTEDGNPKSYIVTVSGSDGVPIQVDAKHCIGCAPIAPKPPA
jgi:hypothetical protein